MSKTKNKTLFLIDSMAMVYRSYFALQRNPLITSKGENVGAVFGFLKSVLRILDEHKPDYFAAVFDTPEPTFRHKLFPEYKATREKMPDEMSDQLPRIREMLETLNIPTIAGLSPRIPSNSNSCSAALDGFRPRAIEIFRPACSTSVRS